MGWCGEVWYSVEGTAGLKDEMGGEAKIAAF